MSFTITIKRSGKQVGRFTGYATRRAALIDANALARGMGDGALASVSAAKATRKKKANPSMSADVAGVVIQQLGGMGKLRAMVAAYDFIRTERNGYPALTFKFKGSKKANAVTITLDPTDTYTLDFVKIVKYDVKPVATFGDVYATGLRSIFERVTGLRLSLSNPGAKPLGKPPTFTQARAALFDAFKAAGWTMSSGSLLVPHATRPDGRIRAWFKAQSVYWTALNAPYPWNTGSKHNLGDAHSITQAGIDIRKVDSAKFVPWFAKNVESMISTRSNPLDHGVLSIPGRTSGLNAELDAFKRGQARAEKAATKVRVASKAAAKAAWAEHGAAMVARYGVKLGAANVRKLLSQQAKWEPDTFLAAVDRFLRE